MAIVQISRITQRKGLLDDLPQPLAGAEFGWAIDQRRLFIGNGDVIDGAPVVGNTEVLTEFSDVLALAGAYTYAGSAGGYIVQTGPTNSDPITQSIQARLDSYAIVTDFGAAGDGSTDDTAAINRALYQIYCIQANTQVRRSLFFPAGTYIITDTLLIPPYAKLYGEGSDSTIILFEVQEWAENTAYSSGVLVKVESLVTPGVFVYYRAVADVPPTGIAITNTDYWNETELPAYVIESADSLQQTGNNIGTNGATAPRNVEVSGMTFQTSETGSHNVCYINRLQQSSFDNVNFAGPLTQDTLTESTADLSGIVFGGTAQVPPTQITLNNCKFTGTTYGIKTNQYVKGVTISNGWFYTLYRGVVLGDTTVVNGGPTGVRIVHNEFDSIYAEGIYIENCSLNASAYNTFYDVGNNFFGSATPQTPVITINAENNLSIGDLFQRTDNQALTEPRIALWNTDTESIPTSIGYAGASNLQLGSYSVGIGQQSTLDDGVTEQTLFTVDTGVVVSKGGFTSFSINYTIKRQVGASDTAARVGVLRVMADAGAGVTINDDYSESADVGVTLVVTQSTDTITVAYTTDATTYDGLIYYSITHFA